MNESEVSENKMKNKCLSFVLYLIDKKAFPRILEFNFELFE
jgi:hypothetical protein